MNGIGVPLDEGQELGPSAGTLLTKGFTIKGCLDKSSWFIEAGSSPTFFFFCSFSSFTR